LGNVLHGDDEALKQRLVQKTYDAVTDGGAFIAIESIIDNERRQNTLGLLMSLHMLIENGNGFDYSQEDFQRWATAAGFRKIEVSPLTGRSSAVVAYRYAAALSLLRLHNPSAFNKIAVHPERESTESSTYACDLIVRYFRSL